MATSSRTDIKPKLKPIGGNTLKLMKTVDEYVMPHSAVDVALMVGGNVGTRLVGGIAKKGAKFVNKIYRNIGK